jgi:SAM-dependent methyltransferase
MTPGSDTEKGETALMPYWDRVATSYAATDPLGAVCYPNAPAWFNRFYARFQLRAVERCLGDLPLHGARCLDVGCGSGRWSRWLAARGAHVIGIDPTEAMLGAARRLSPEVEFQRMSATAITLPPESFDLVTAVTVIQHLAPDEQLSAVHAVSNMVKPGGTLFVFDLIDPRDRGRLVFPRPPEEWIDLYRREGMELVSWSGQEFAPLIRVLTALAGSGRRSREPRDDVTAPSVVEAASRRRAVFLPLWPVVQLSYPLEVLCEWLLPGRAARHGCFRFRKPPTRAGVGSRSASHEPRT